MAVAIGDSNGCASGATLEEAKTAAILELIEWDATARWWYGRSPRPVILSRSHRNRLRFCQMAQRPPKTKLHF